MTQDESSLMLKRCLVAAVIRRFRRSHLRSIQQICEAFHRHWKNCPRGLELSFIQLQNEDPPWFSQDIREALLWLREFGWVCLADGGSNIIAHTIDSRLMSWVLQTQPLIAQHTGWVGAIGERIEEELASMSDP